MSRTLSFVCGFVVFCSVPFSFADQGIADETEIASSAIVVDEYYSIGSPREISRRVVAIDGIPIAEQDVVQSEELVVLQPKQQERSSPPGFDVSETFAKISVGDEPSSEPVRTSVRRPTSDDDEEAADETDTVLPVVRGQITTGSLPSELGDRPGLARGQMEAGAIPEKLRSPTTESTNTGVGGPSQQNLSAGVKKSESGTGGQVNGGLLIATIVAIMGLVYVGGLAIDYRQRWMQSLLSQNESFAVSGEGFGGRGMELTEGTFPYLERLDFSR